MEPYEHEESGTMMHEAIEGVDERISVQNLSERASSAIKDRVPNMPEGGHRFYAERPLVIGGAMVALGFGLGLMFSPSGRHSHVTPGSGHMAKDLAEKGRELKDRGIEKTKEVAEDAKEKAVELKDRGIEKTQEVAERTSRKAEELADRGAEKTQEVADRTSRKAEEMKSD